LVTSIIDFLVGFLLTTIHLIRQHVFAHRKFLTFNTQHVFQGEAKSSHVGISTICWLDLISTTFITRYVVPCRELTGRFRASS
jgi:hypothetical protein